MIVNDHLDVAAEKTKEKIQWLLDLERNPTTLNTHYFSDYKDKFLSFYKASRDQTDLAIKLNRDRHMYNNSINKVLSGLNEIGISAQANDLPKLLPPDPVEAALNIMASVRAYFQGKHYRAQNGDANDGLMRTGVHSAVAYKRISDMIPMAIDHEVILGVQRGIDKALQDGLQITGPDGYNRCKNMLEERVHIVSSRREIQEKMQRLQAARQELRRLM